MKVSEFKSHSHLAIENLMTMPAGLEAPVAKPKRCECCGEKVEDDLTSVNIIPRKDMNNEEIYPADAKVCRYCYNSLMSNSHRNFLLI